MSGSDDVSIVHLISTIFIRHPEYLVDLNALAKELKTDARTIEQTDLAKKLSNPDMAIFIALIDNQVIGMATLHVVRDLLAIRGIVHNVIVSDTARGKGVGIKLMNALIDLARSEKLDSVDLTSRRERTAAHKLYEKLGFRTRDTSVYRLDLSKEDKP